MLLHWEIKGYDSVMSTMSVDVYLGVMDVIVPNGMEI